MNQPERSCQPVVECLTTAAQHHAATDRGLALLALLPLSARLGLVMYEVAAKTIKGGLSKGARLLLGIMAGLFGLVMLATVSGSPSPIGVAMFGALCIAIAIACATSGRLRQFLGSLVATAVFCVAIWYVWGQLTGGAVLSGRKSEPSILNAFLFFVFFGVPSAAYVISARFGFSAKQAP